MTQPRSDTFSAGRATLRTLMLIRWIAAGGQLAAVLVVYYGLGFDLPLLSLLVIIGGSLVVNLLTPLYRRGRRISATDAAMFLGFDIVQLAAMLDITGGLANPFALLVLGPITVAAGLLPRAHAAALTLLAIACLTLIGLDAEPLPWGAEPPSLPLLYIFSIWSALVIACCFIAWYNWTIADDTRRVSDALSATHIALAREQRWSALGALAAAAAHELGSPLSTIAVIANELSRDVPKDSPFIEDITLLQSQSDRCREILAELARRPEPASAPFDSLPLPALIEAVANPYARAGVVFVVDAASLDESASPIVARTPELMHGLGNIVQNAMQFARTRVTAIMRWDAAMIEITICDDGPGFPANLLGRLGEPYISTRTHSDEHLGLGIFIAITLLERTGASIHFDNGYQGGAEIACHWQRKFLEISK